MELLQKRPDVAINALIIFLVTLVLVLILTPIFRKVAERLNILDRPAGRKIHPEPVPYLGGVAIYLSFVIPMVAFLFTHQTVFQIFSKQFIGFFLATLFVVVTGVVDDWKKLGALWKLGIQIVAATLLFVADFRIDFIANPLGGVITFPPYISFLITVLWMVTFINAINFLDGLDGLAAGVVFIASIALLGVAFTRFDITTIFLTAAIAGSCLGFLKYNRHPASIFMGDSGSMFLGMMVGIVGIQSVAKATTVAALFIPALAVFIPVYDIINAFFRRISHKASIFTADKEHFHHRLLRLGVSHRRAVWIFYSVGIYFGILAFLFLIIPDEFVTIIVVLLAIGIFIVLRTFILAEGRVKIGETDLMETVTEVVNMMIPQAKSKDITLKYRTESDIKLPIDKTKLRLICLYTVKSLIDICQNGTEVLIEPRGTPPSLEISFLETIGIETVIRKALQDATISYTIANKSEGRITLCITFSEKD